jgi:hypothetical protein
MTDMKTRIAKGGVKVTLTITNQLNDNYAIEFCLGDKEYILEPDEVIEVEVNDEDCICFDDVRAR